MSLSVCHSHSFFYSFSIVNHYCYRCCYVDDDDDDDVSVIRTTSTSQQLATSTPMSTSVTSSTCPPLFSSASWRPEVLSPWSRGVADVGRRKLVSIIFTLLSSAVLLSLLLSNVQMCSDYSVVTNASGTICTELFSGPDVSVGTMCVCPDNNSN